MKGAVRAAEEAGSLGTLLHQLFQRTLSMVKEVRNTTSIGEQSVSLAAAAVRLSERVFGDLLMCICTQSTTWARWCSLARRHNKQRCFKPRRLSTRGFEVTCIGYNCARQ